MVNRMNQLDHLPIEYLNETTKKKSWMITKLRKPKSKNLCHWLKKKWIKRKY